MVLSSESLDGAHVGTTEECSRRMLKKGQTSHRPTPTRQDASFRGQGRSE